MPQRITIYSENNEFQHAEVLKRNREKRQKNKEFFVEGVKPIEQVMANRWEVTTLLHDKERSLSDWAKNIIEVSNAQKILELPSELMQKLSDKEETSELIALVRMQKDDLARIPITEPFLTVILDRPASPGNLGTIIRTCDAFSINGIIITGHAADVYDAKTIRASVGTVFSTPVIRVGSPQELLPWLERVKHELGTLQIIGTSAKGTKTLAQQDFKTPTVLLLGNETLGLSAQYKAMSDALVRIPIRGAASSLNVASVASMFLYEIERQRNERD
ncbi:TPA: RNA methyltransferase [Candidatus Woesearchaeota archaeon]|nr:RNA methyltransferase [Candidatus Woesearchaeota archaeon]